MADEPDRTEWMERELNRLELVSRWADDLAHEIKNPFHAMVINLELVKRRAGDAEGLRERAEVVESELHRVHGLIDSVLKLVRPWPRGPTADADAVFEALLPALRARASLRQIEYTHQPGGGRVALPAADLALVALNLLDRAMDRLPAGGTLVTRCARDDDAVRIEISAHADPEADVGPVEPRDAADRGMAVTRRLVDRAGGSVHIGSEEGAGTTIALRLPRAGTA